MILAHKDVNAKAVSILSGISHVEHADLSSEDVLIERLKGKKVLVIRSKPKVTRRVFESCSGLRLVVRLGIGLDNIDTDAAKEFGVKVVNTPGATTESVAEHTLGLALSLLRNIPHAHISVCGKRWERKRFQGSELHGKTWGILGFGRIGRRLADLLRVFGTNILVYDPYVSDTGPFTRFSDLHAFLRASDIVSVHVPLTSETRSMISGPELDCFSGYLINTSRGGVVDESALYKALKSGSLAGAALDVFENEPLVDSPLFGLENIILTPHLGGSTKEGQDRAARHAADLISKELTP